MCSTVPELLSSARSVVASLDESWDAVALVSQLSEIERLVSAARAVAAARVAESRAWRASGASSAAAWVAARAGVGLRDAAATLQAGAALDSLPATKAAALSGRLSSPQLAAITEAATADHAAERSLLSLATNEPLSVLRAKCADVIAAAAGDEDATERIRRARYFRTWTDRDNAVRLNGRFAADDVAGLLQVVRARAERLRRDGRFRESPEACAADALCSLVGSDVRATVQVVVSESALSRGHTVAGETCRIEGVGPVSVSAATRLMTAGSVRRVTRSDGDIHQVSSASRSIPPRVRAALEARDATCVVPGCTRRHGLEIDHVVPYAAGGRTELSNLARLCRWHHAQKTHHGWRLEGEPGAWQWLRRRARAPDTS